MSNAFRDAYSFVTDNFAKDQQNALNKRVGGMMAGGDTSGAVNALYGAGNLTAAQNLQTAQRQQTEAQRKAEAEGAARIAKGIRSAIKSGVDPRQAYDYALQAAPALGLDPSHLQKLRPQYEEDPARWLDFVDAQSAKAIRSFQSGRNLVGIEEDTGREAWKYRLPSDGKPIALDPDKNYYMEDEAGPGIVPENPDRQSGAPAGAGPGIVPERAPAIPSSAPVGIGGEVPRGYQMMQDEAAGYRDAIANIESRGSGDYKAEGPATRTGDKAYGRYQVMGANIPQWTREVLGRAMTPQEFLNNPQAQDAVFDAKFGEFAQRYGSPEEAASVWFTGKPRAQGAARRDQLGTSGAEYVQKFAQNMGQPQLPGRETASDAPPEIPGYRLIQRGTGRAQDGWFPDPQNPGFLINGKGDVKADPRLPQEQWRDLPGGGQINTRTGKKEGVAGADKPPTEAQAKAVNFTYRTIKANDRLNALIRKGVVKPRTVSAQLFETDKNGAVRIVTKTPEDRQFIQAAKEWLMPVLRKDTGAVVTDEELRTYMDIFIPRYEDDAALLRQKAEARQDIMKALAGEAGPLFSKTHGRMEFRSHWAPDPRPAGGGKPSSGWGKMTVR